MFTQHLFSCLSQGKSPSSTLSSEIDRQRPSSMFATMPLPKPSSSNNNGDPSSSATLLKTQSLRTGPPSKPPRKKRPAPLPPSMKQNSVNQSLPNVKGTTTKEISVDVLTAVVHSRTSSHSSGFNETTSSPLESPGNSSHDSTARVADIAEERAKTEPERSAVTDHLPSRDSIPSVVYVQPEPSIEITSPCLSNTSLDGDGDSSTLRRKRKAPKPPPGGE